MCSIRRETSETCFGSDEEGFRLMGTTKDASLALAKRGAATKALSLSHRQFRDDSMEMMGFSQLEIAGFININT